jgi:hypothetical protein
MVSSWKEQLYPAELVQSALTEDFETFRVRHSECGFLLVALKANFSEVAVGLSGTIQAGDEGTPVMPSLSVMNYSTAMYEPGRESLIGGGDAPALFAEREAVEVLKASPCFIVPLRKRIDAESAFAERISVGRARNKDIVLRHPSISKFHAWFEVDEIGTVYVADAGSKNGTRLDGGYIVARMPLAIMPGSRVVFGKVQTVYSPCEVLWRALRS